MNIERILQTLRGKSAEERQRLRVNADDLLVHGTAEQKAAAQRLLDAMSALAQTEHQSLLDRLGGMEVTARAAEAFRALPMSETERKLVQVLLDHPSSTSTQLSAALGWGGQIWHLHFGTMCKTRADYLWPAPRAEQRDADFYSGILTEFDENGARFTMKRVVAEAFEAMGLKARRA